VKNKVQPQLFQSRFQPLFFFFLAFLAAPCPRRFLSGERENFFLSLAKGLFFQTVYDPCDAIFHVPGYVRFEELRDPHGTVQDQHDNQKDAAKNGCDQAI
jgi:hypothetical protein